MKKNLTMVLLTTVVTTTVTLTACNDGYEPPKAQPQTQQRTTKQNPLSIEQNITSDSHGNVIVMTNGGLTIEFLALDYLETPKYVYGSYNNTGIHNTYNPNYRFTESSIQLMPHRTYKVSIYNTNNAFQGKSFHFVQTGALAPVKTDAVPSIFAGAMIKTGVFKTTAVNGAYQYNNSEVDKILTIDPVSNQVPTSTKITPFYAGNLDIADEDGNIVASVQVGQFINPVFEASYPATHPLIGGVPNREGYKFNVSNGGLSNGGSTSICVSGLDTMTGPNSTFIDTYGFSDKINDLIAKSPDVKPLLPRAVLNAEGRYFPTDLLYQHTVLDKGTSCNVYTVYVWVDHYLNYQKYSNFSTTLPVPSVFDIAPLTAGDNRQAPDRRFCMANLFYTDNLSDVTLYSGFSKDSYFGEGINPVPRSGFNSSAYCVTYDTNQRRDIRAVSNYNEQSDTNRAVRLQW